MAQKNAVKWLKEMSRERVPAPRGRFIPDKRQTEWARNERVEIEDSRDEDE